MTGALIFLSVGLNVVLILLVIRLLSKNNSLNADMAEIKKIVGRSVKEPAPKKKPEPKKHTPLYLR